MKRTGSLIILVLLTLLYVYLNLFTDIIKNNIIINYLLLFLILICLFYFLFSRNETSVNGKDKLVKTLLENSDTIYILLNSKNKKVLYLSNNVNELLGIDTNKSNDEIVHNILNIPVIKSEIDNFDNTNSYVSEMISYDNPKYNHEMWLRIKIYPYKENDKEYYVVQILDASKEHDRQHLLISQATDIKSREAKLNQITAASYDVEMNINLTTNSYELKYYKKDNLYFGEEKRGTYTEGLKEILSYINENDREKVFKELSLDNLKNHFTKYELDSITLRYRLGNEVKNNTWLESTIFFITNRQKNMISILTKNVTENAENIREQNVLLQNALNEAKIADKSKTELISTISHDIRTPLTNIIGISESLLSSNLENSIKDDIQNINSSSEDVLDIIDGLLDTSKIEKKLIEKNEKQYSVLKMFKALENTTKEFIGEKNIKLNFNLDNNLPVILYGDNKRITQAINQILNNSVKYTDEGEINVNVRGEKINNNVKLIVEVSDTGIGIKEERLNSIMNSKDNTTGLGNVKSLMKLLGGTLEIESKEGEYTKVTVTFIQRIVEDNKVRELMKKNKEAEEFNLSGKKVLIVDDNKLNLKVTERLLEPYSLDVTLLESGEECIDLLKENNNFDLILMDQMMPGLDGTETLKKLKENPSFNIPVVVLTADAMEGQKEKYLSEGFNDYISKPIDRSELAKILKKFIKDNN